MTDVRGTRPLVSREATLFAGAPLREKRRPSAHRGMRSRASGSVRSSSRSDAVRRGRLVWHDNFNLLVCSPWALAMAWGGLGVALGRDTGPRVLARRAAEGATISGAGVLLALLFGQDSLRVALLVVPPLAGVWLGARAAYSNG